MINRHLLPVLAESNRDTPAVVLVGPRQSGKTTLARALRKAGHYSRYLTLDDLAVLEAARRDPAGFVDGLDGGVIIDEIQRAPEILLPIKAAIDRDRRPGAFLLTGSADVFALPTVADALVGRVEVHVLHPFSVGELAGRPETFLTEVFGEGDPGWAPTTEGREELVALLARGGFPEAVARSTQRRRAAWFESYLATLVQRDLRDLSGIAGLADMPRLLRLLAARGAGLLNLAGLARDADLAPSTCTRYLALCEQLFLVHRLPAWATNLGKRLVKSPKLHLEDVGLAGFLLGKGSIAPDDEVIGPLAETLAVNELRKQVTWSAERIALHHFRTAAQQEVDIVLERADGRLVGVEVKAGSRVTDRDLRGLRLLRESARDRFHRGLVLYTGREVVPLGDDLSLVPFARLWS